MSSSGSSKTAAKTGLTASEESQMVAGRMCSKLGET
jgi:hypothetical protein